MATAEIASAYKAFSVDKIMGRVGVYIGLDHANITLDAMPIYYNEVRTEDQSAIAVHLSVVTR